MNSTFEVFSTVNDELIIINISKVLYVCTTKKIGVFRIYVGDDCLFFDIKSDTATIERIFNC